MPVAAGVAGGGLGTATGAALDAARGGGAREGFVEPVVGEHAAAMNAAATTPPVRKSRECIWSLLNSIGCCFATNYESLLRADPNARNAHRPGCRTSNATNAGTLVAWASTPRTRKPRPWSKVCDREMRRHSPLSPSPIGDSSTGTATGCWGHSMRVKYWC